MITPDSIIDDIIRREGGAVDNPSDRGGTTKYGITKKTLSDYRGHAVTGVEVFNLSEVEAREIYTLLYLKPFAAFNEPSKKIKPLLVDMAVNHGVERAIKILQSALKVMQDGVIGHDTLAAYAGADKEPLYLRLIAKRIQFYGRIIADDRTQHVFAAGWMNRVAEFL